MLYSAACCRAPSLAFELDGIESSLQQMDGAVVGGDDEVAVVPVGVFVCADEKFEGELFDHKIVAAWRS